MQSKTDMSFSESDQMWTHFTIEVLVKRFLIKCWEIVVFFIKCSVDSFLLFFALYKENRHKNTTG